MVTQLHLSMSGLAIEEGKKTKLLGVVFDGQLSWSEHIDGIVNKMGRGIAMTRTCMTYLTLYCLSSVSSWAFFTFYTVHSYGQQLLRT